MKGFVCVVHWLKSDVFGTVTASLVNIYLDWGEKKKSVLLEGKKIARTFV